MAQNNKDYKNGKIYCIRNNINDDIYVGSTTQRLSKRMAKHREDSKRENKMHSIFYSKVNEIGIEHFYIELIEDCPCDTLEQLLKREGHYIREMGTLNHKIAGRTHKEWEQDNKDKLQIYQKEYAKQNKETIKEYRTEYKQVNKELETEEPRQTTPILSESDSEQEEAQEPTRTFYKYTDEKGNECEDVLSEILTKEENGGPKTFKQVGRKPEKIGENIRDINGQILTKLYYRNGEQWAEEEKRINNKTCD